MESEFTQMHPGMANGREKSSKIWESNLSSSIRSESVGSQTVVAPFFTLLAQ